MALEMLTERPQRPEHATPILMIHGAWHGAWCWAEHFLRYFAERGYEAHALSLRGHAASDPRQRMWHRVRDYVADVEEAVGRLGCAPVLIGHSMGGFIIQKYLEKHSAPAGVLLASLPSAGALGLTLRTAARQPGALLKTNLTLRPDSLVRTPELARELFFSPDMPAGLIAKYHALLKDESFRAYLDTLVLDLPSPEKVRTPMLFLGAENDRMFPMREITATAQAYGASAEFFPGMAHDMMLEAGWQTVAERIASWLGNRVL